MEQPASKAEEDDWHEGVQEGVEDLDQAECGKLNSARKYILYLLLWKKFITCIIEEINSIQFNNIKKNCNANLKVAV